MDTLYTPRGRHYSRNQKRKPDPPLNTPPSLPPPTVVLPSSSSPTRGSTPTPTQSRPTSSLYKCNSLLSVNHNNATGGDLLNHLVNYGEFVGRNGLWERMRASMGHKHKLKPKKILPEVTKVKVITRTPTPTMHPSPHHSRMDKSIAALELRHTFAAQREAERTERRKAYDHSHFMKWKRCMEKGKPLERILRSQRDAERTLHPEEQPPPFTEEEYRHLLTVFEEVDTDADGQLSFQDLCKAGSILRNKTFDIVQFRRVDKDRSGLVDFMEVLRMFYPTAPVAVLQKCTKSWGMPESRGLEVLNMAKKTWRDRLDEEAIAEILQMFNILTGHSGQLTFEMMRSRLVRMRSTSDVLNIAQEMFTQTDVDGDGVLNLEEFGTMMEHAFRER
eukprot:PhF_6_TR4838/c0_g1_i2/m.6738